MRVILLDEGVITVHNTATKQDGSFDEIFGTATVPDPNHPGELKGVCPNHVIKYFFCNFRQLLFYSCYVDKRVIVHTLFQFTSQKVSINSNYLQLLYREVKGILRNQGFPKSIFPWQHWTREPVVK